MYCIAEDNPDFLVHHSFFSVVIKIKTDRSQLRKERFTLVYISRSHIIILEKPRAETQAEISKGCCLLPCQLAHAKVAFLYSPSPPT